MPQSPTPALTQSAQAAVRADHLARDREAWNLPRVPVTAAARGAGQRGLDWEGFRDLYYPDRRRHDFEAVVAYGAYRKSTTPAAA
jgi:hypothetical protein